MRHTILAILCLLTVACGSSQPTSPSPTPNPNPNPTPSPTPQMFTLSGRITENAFSPVADATVAVMDGPNAGRTRTTDPLGSYRLADLVASTFTMTVSSSGFQTKSMTVNLTADQTLDITLTRTSP
jgi:hypothetical protein